MSSPASTLLFAVYRGDDGSSSSQPQRLRGETDGHETLALSASESALVARLILGDADAFREILVEHFDALARFAAGILAGDRDAAEDVVQTVLARLWERHRDFAPGMPIRAYLYRAVRNRALDAAEYAAVRLRGQARLQRENDASATDAPLEHPEAEVLRKALLTLTERRRTALRLRYEEGLGYAEIGTVMGISTGSAEQLVFHSIRALRKKITGGV